MKNLSDLTLSMSPCSYPSLKMVKLTQEKNYIKWVLNHTEWNVARSARIANVERKHFYDLMKKHGIKRTGQP